jgi:hypothetical protein
MQQFNRPSVAAFPTGIAVLFIILRRGFGLAEIGHSHRTGLWCDIASGHDWNNKVRRRVNFRLGLIPCLPWLLKLAFGCHTVAGKLIEDRTQRQNDRPPTMIDQDLLN